MTQQLIVTTPANTQTGDSPKLAFDKVNANFSELYGVFPQTVYTPPFTGGIQTTVAAKLSQTISVIDFGADPTGSVDSTTAITTASRSNTTIFFPPGTYKVTNLVLTNIHNITWLGAGVGGVTITTTTPGTMVTMNGGNFSIIDGFNFLPTGTLANSTGLLIQNGTGNTTIRNCLFQLWTNAGCKCVGTIGTTLSGNKFYDNFFLQNASVAGVGQLDMTYNNDFFITHNQFGIINTGTFGFPTYGIQANNCGNGQFDSNFVWSNTVGANFVNCPFARIFSNRFEQSQKEGFIANGCTVVQFNNNWLNNNGNLTTNTYNDMRWISCSGMTIQGNQGYDWLGGVPQEKYFGSIESSSQRFVISGNQANPAPSGYATAAWFFDSTTPATSVTTDGALKYSSGNTVAAATTTFLGQGVSVGAFFIGQQYLEKTHTIVQLIGECTGAPGAGQTFVYTLFKNGSATGLTLTISGASTFQAVSNATTVIEDVANGSSYSVQLVTSAGAVAAAHAVQVVFCGK